MSACNINRDKKLSQDGGSNMKPSLLGNRERKRFINKMLKRKLSCEDRKKYEDALKELV
jgi:hypothetical protein